MYWYHYLLLASFSVFLVSSGFHLSRLIRSGAPTDYAPAAGETSAGILYSFTGAMNPKKKESAFLHLPTYISGILFHLGTFLSIPLFILILIGLLPVNTLTYLLSAFLFMTGISGVGILAKRIMKHELRSLSSPDDYISNLLVTLFQLFTAVALIWPATIPWYFLLTSCLLLYFPMGKLKHALYFFAARYHLGYFYGYRGVWPPKTLKL